MTSAFNWSPGGCCCEPASRLFDLYVRADDRPGFARVPTIFGGLQPNSSSAIDWQIEPANQGVTGVAVLSSLRPHGGSEKVWTYEERVNPQATVNPGVTIRPHVVCYDVIEREELAAFDLVERLFFTSTTSSSEYPTYPVQNAGEPSAAFNVAGCSGDTFAFAWRSGTSTSYGYLELHSDGTAFPVLPSARNNNRFNSAHRIVEDGVLIYSGQTTNPIFSLAARSWPRVAYKSGGNCCVGTMSFVEDFLHQVPYGGRFDINRVANLGPGTWVYFDASPDHYAAVLKNCPGIKLIIDGNVILQYPDVDQTFPANEEFPFQAPHVSGTGHIVVPQFDYTDTTNQIFKDPARNYTAVIYFDGSELWRTPSRLHPTACRCSSDRWLYLTGWDGLAKPANTVGDYEALANANWETGYYAWVARQDGSQFAPLGTLGGQSNVRGDYDPKIALFPTIGPPYGPVLANGCPSGTHDVVYDSQAVGDTLPEDANDFEAAAQAN